MCRKVRPDFGRGFCFCRGTIYRAHFVAPASSRRFLFLHVVCAPASVFSVLSPVFSLSVAVSFFGALLCDLCDPVSVPSVLSPCLFFFYRLLHFSTLRLLNFSFQDITHAKQKTKR